MLSCVLHPATFYFPEKPITTVKKTEINKNIDSEFSIYINDVLKYLEKKIDFSDRVGVICNRSKPCVISGRAQLGLERNFTKKDTITRFKSVESFRRAKKVVSGN